ncbi:MAG: hypothetical protein KJZ84_05375 [Bryobacteraceae bacterium]|jgi:hypothetical protein|nr:hypothetical protein [Bryobacteraceae bacterium]
MQAPANTYRSYALSMWRWIAPGLKSEFPDVQARLDADLALVLGGVGLRQAFDGEAPDLLLRYEAAPGVLFAELVDARTNERVWRTHLRGQDILSALPPDIAGDPNLN